VARYKPPIGKVWVQFPDDTEPWSVMTGNADNVRAFMRRIAEAEAEGATRVFVTVNGVEQSPALYAWQALDAIAKTERSNA
jgi:hypothetical protein